MTLRTTTLFSVLGLLALTACGDTEDTAVEETNCEVCDGIDNNGDGQIDEGFTDSDGDGVADCVDAEECGDCVDNDGDGEIDEDCTYELTFVTTADDAFTAYIDGAELGDGQDWSQSFTFSTSVGPGTHHLAVEAWDIGRVVAGFIGAVYIDGDLRYLTGEGSWRVSSSYLGDGWETSLAGTSPDNPTSYTWGNRPADLLAEGAQWVWSANYADPYSYPENYYVLEFDACDGAEPLTDLEVCDGYDNDGDGLIDEDFADTDGDDIADCVDEEECDGLDNNGDGYVDEGFEDTDEDGIADCVDEEECDGLDNDGDGLVDEGFSDTDEDGIADCMDEEECGDCLDNNGDGEVDEGCSYELELLMTADDSFTAYLDGAEWGDGQNWSTSFLMTDTVSAGSHTIAVEAHDIGRSVAGFIAAVSVDGDLISLTGDGSWIGTAITPSSGWETTGAGLTEQGNLCGYTWGSRPADIIGLGASWIWIEDCYNPSKYTDNWYFMEFDTCEGVTTTVSETKEERAEEAAAEAAAEAKVSM